MPGSITGTVRSAAIGAPVNEAVVKTIPPTNVDTTDATGFYILQSIPAGDYRIITAAPDFAPDTSAVSVSSGVTVTKHIALAATIGAISGTITWRGPNTPISGAVVHTNPASSIDTSNANGNYFLSRVPLGSYSVIAEAQGYDMDSTQAIVSTEVPVTAGVSLEAVVPSQGLLAYYPFNGNANDESGHGNNGLVSGAILTPDRQGTPNRAYSFDGWNNHIEIPDIIRDTISAFTISAWVYTNDGNTNRIFLYNGANTGEVECEIRNSSFSFAVKLQDLDWFQTFCPPILGQFVHFVGVYRRGNSAQLWINGVLRDNIAVPFGTLTHGRTTLTSSIGSYAPQWLDWARQNNTYAWLGAIDQVRVYSRALSQFEIQALYYSGE
jgi:hypothetical protein